MPWPLYYTLDDQSFCVVQVCVKWGGLLRDVLRHHRHKQKHLLLQFCVHEFPTI